MEKVVFDWSIPENIEMEIMGKKILVKPYLTLAEQVKLLGVYFDALLSPETKSISADKWATFDAEYALRLALIDTCTNISLDGDFEKILYNSEVWYDISNEIMNYGDFSIILEKIEENVKLQISQEKSLGSVIDGLREKVEKILNDISEASKNMTPEDIEKLKTIGTELTEKIKSSELVQKVLGEVERGSESA